MAASSATSASSSAGISARLEASARELAFTARDYDLAATLGCGQAFRWDLANERWTGVIGGRWVELCQSGNTLSARTAIPQSDWNWLHHYLQSELDLNAVLATFPQDEPMRLAMAQCRGLRLLRQPVWECLASFILSSTKQIVQIRQIVTALCARHGMPVAVPASVSATFAFPTAVEIARLDEATLRACKMGFRAPYLLAAARAVAEGRLDLEHLPTLPLEEAREQLVALPGVGPKVADCALLFGCGFPTAFPVDVWVMKALRQSYFRNRAVKLEKLRRFSATYFGPHGGYAQQYLFHALRQSEGKKLSR